MITVDLHSSKHSTLPFLKILWMIFLYKNSLIFFLYLVSDLYVLYDALPMMMGWMHVVCVECAYPLLYNNIFL